jgi:hypothetical protein
MAGRHPGRCLALSSAVPIEPDKLSRDLTCCAFRRALFEIRDGDHPYRFSTWRPSDRHGRRLGHPICASPSSPPCCRILSCKLFCTAAKDVGLNITSFGQVLMAFAIVSVLGVFLQVDAAGGGPDQKRTRCPPTPPLSPPSKEQSRWRPRASRRKQAT